MKKSAIFLLNSPLRSTPRILTMRAVTLTTSLLALASPVLGQTAPTAVAQLAPVTVTGNYDNAVGSSDAASQGSVTAKLIESRPTLRPAELLEFVPGVIVTQHSGDGKATSISCAASTSTTAPTSRASSAACRSTCRRTRTATATAI